MRVAQRPCAPRRRAAHERDRAAHGRSAVDARATRKPLSPQKIAELDSALNGADSTAARFEHVKLFAPDGRLAFADERELIGDRGASEDFRRALAGAVVSEVEREVGDGGEQAETALEVYTPLRLQAGGPVEGVLELYLDYAPTAAAVHDDTRTLYGLLFAGFGAPWFSLFTIVGRASRTLRRRALHDPLTGLPNRTSMHDRVVRVTGAVRRSWPTSTTC